jgi:initiation factor 1A
MVKNFGGGKRAKGMARKNLNNTKQEKPLRVAQEEGEIYAVVTKYFGNGMCDVYCMDDETRLCHIRGIFRTRGKRDNCVELGSWLLVGKRDFETVVKGKKQNCDLLEVYNNAEKARLRTTETSVQWSKFAAYDQSSFAKNEEEVEDSFGIKFADATETEYLDLMARVKDAVPNVSEATVDQINAILGTHEISLDDL